MESTIRELGTKRVAHICCATILVLLSSSPSLGQSDTCKHELKLGLEFKTHGEVRGGGLPRNMDSDEAPVEFGTAYIMGRVRISAMYLSKLIDGKVTLQNQSSWGSKGNTELTLYEGWAKIKAPFGLFGQVGRMPLSYDDERILGPNDWAMAKLCHDVLRLGYEGHGHKVHAILGYNQNNDNKIKGTFFQGGAQPYKTMQTLWYHYDIPKTHIGASLLFMNTGMQAGTEKENPHVENQQLVGTYLDYSPKFMKAEAAYYKQMGHDEWGIKIDAWMASAKVTVNITSKYATFVGFDYLSGDDYVPVIKKGALGLPRHEVIRGFSTIYGSHHKFYGIMDYFYESAHSQGFSPGLQNAFIGGLFNPIAPLSIKLAYHYLATSTTLQDYGMTLGHDFDLEAAYNFNKDISLSAGFSYMIGTKTLDELKQGTSTKSVRWGWFSLIISPSLFSKKW